MMAKTSASDFHLPDEILSIIPTDPYDQLDLARKITSMAISSRVSNLELEAGRLRERISEKDWVIGELEGEVSRLERMFQEADAMLRAAVEENVKLCRERDMLAVTAKKLSRNLDKLENFKKHLMESLSEDNSPSLFQLTSEDVDSGTGDQSDLNTLQESSNTEQKYSLTPYITPRLTPAATPKVTSSSTSPRRYSATVSPKMTSGSISPTKAHIEGKATLSPWYISSQQSSAANSPRGLPLPGQTPRIDGKEFFRQARARLSYEQFAAFLANIKEFNAHRQSREETLKKADEIFGTDYKDLYLLFQGMLNRHLP